MACQLTFGKLSLWTNSPIDYRRQKLSFSAAFQCLGNKVGVKDLVVYYLEPQMLHHGRLLIWKRFPLFLYFIFGVLE